ncbi:AAA family ATPase [Streptomyces sp. NPDC001890]|uniref:AAA family ATPase n=1 Tax=Streptomyces sp. NPDC001890 TaxID=3364620 RepID=UPI00367DDB6C
MNTLTESLRGLAPGALVVAIGPGASGKSTAALTAPVDAVISLDVLRGRIGTSQGDQSATPAAVEQQNRLLDTFLAAGRRVFLDSTNVEPHVRSELVERARRHQRPIIALRFGTDLDTCRARNRSRQEDRRVPDDVLTWQWSLTQQATPQVLMEEGFAAVYEAASTTPSTAPNLP